MAVFRFPHQYRVTALPTAGFLLLAACAVDAPVRMPAPPAAPARSCLVLVGLSPQIAPPCHQSARRELRGGVSKALIDSGRYRILETEVVALSEPTPFESRRIAKGAGAELVALLRLHHLEIRTGVHHVRHYHDGSAAGELVLIDVATGTIERAARQTIHLSTRARYSSSAYARDLLLTRLAEKLSRDVLGVPSTASSGAG